ALCAGIPFVSLVALRPLDALRALFALIALWALGTGVAFRALGAGITGIPLGSLRAFWPLGSGDGFGGENPHHLPPPPIRWQRVVRPRILDGQLPKVDSLCHVSRSPLHLQTRRAQRPWLCLPCCS